MPRYDEQRWRSARSELRAAFVKPARRHWPIVRVWLLPNEDVEFLAGDWIKPTDRAPRKKPWLISGVLRRTEEGPPILSELSVEPGSEDVVEVTGTVLRGIPVAIIRERVLGWPGPIAKTREIMAATGGWNVTAEDVKRAKRVAAAAARQPLNRGRRGYPHDHYRRIALRYLALLEERRDVLVGLAQEESDLLGKAVPRETVRDWVRRATELGFLVPGTPGRASNRPGPNLYKKEEDDG
jgi:hypothetical protein